MSNPEFFEANIVHSSPYDIEYAKSNPDWHNLKECYERNYLQSSNGDIPKIIHFIWLGGDVPKKYLINIDDWSKFNPEFKIKLWTDESVKDFDFHNKAKFLTVQNFGAKADILRYAILYHYGGLYVDTDFLCLDNFLSLNNSLDFYSGICLEYNPQINNGIVACVPGHPIMKSCLENINIIDEPSHSEIMCQTGPWHITKYILEYVKTNKDKIVLFPSNFFYSFPAIYRHRPTMQQIYSFAKSYSKAIHLWHTAWQQ